VIRLSVVLPSIRPGKLRRHVKSMECLAPDIPRDEIQLIVIYQDPLTYQMCTDMGVNTPVYHPRTPSDQPVPFVELRSRGFEKAVGEYILMIDDDHTYVRRNEHRPSSGEYLRECLEYMDANPDVGTLSTNGHFGSVAWQYEIKKDPKNGLVGISKGLLARNNIELMPTDEERALLGMLEESIYIYGMMAKGYSHAKRFLNPTKLDPSKYMGYPGNPTYSYDVVAENIGGYIQKRYKDIKWHHESRRFPKGLLVEQRVNKRKRGW